MTMTRYDRPSGHDRDAEPVRRASPPGSLPIRVAEAVVRRPLSSSAALVSVAMLGVIFGNALANQPARHPHPWFSTRPVAAEPARSGVAPAPALAPVAAPAPAQVQATPNAPAPAPAVLPRPRPTSSLDQPGQIQELQTALRDRGFYAGPIDSVLGPATSEAVRAFERRLGAPQTGEVSDLLLAALRALPPVALAQPQVPPAAPTLANAHRGDTRTGAVNRPAPPAGRSAATPVDPPMRIATADAVAYPVAADEVQVVEIDTPVSTGSIRRAAREPLAPGGDERLQKIQRALIAAGYGPLKADGRWDDRSGSAVRRYEADRGWTITGRPSDRLVYGLMLDGSRPRR